MFVCVVLIFVLQICYSSALSCTCDCPGQIVLPNYAAYLLGVITPSLLVSTVILAVLFYRHKYGKGIDHTVLGIERHVSLSKYEIQESGPSYKNNRYSLTDERAQLKCNEIREDLCSENEDDDSDIDHVDANKTNEIKVEPSKTVSRIPHQIQQSVFPPLNKEQMNQLLKGVLDKTAPKSTSLSDLDKIVSDAKKEQEEEKTKALQNSASTTKLDADTTPPPTPVMKLPKFEANSIGCKLNEEMKAKFGKGNKFKFKDSEINPDGSAKNIEAKQNDVICSVLIHEEKIQDDSSKAVVLNNETAPQLQRNNLTEEGALKKEQISENIESDKGDDQDDLYDSPPPPRPQANLNDNQLSKEFTTPYRQSDLYDFPPSPRPHDDLYDFPPIRNPNEICDFSPTKDDLYDVPASKAKNNGTPKKNRIVSDGNESGYVFPVSNPDSDLGNSEYSNARSMHSPNFL